MKRKKKICVLEVIKQTKEGRYADFASLENIIEKNLIEEYLRECFDRKFLKGPNRNTITGLSAQGHQELERLKNYGKKTLQRAGITIAIIVIGKLIVGFSISYYSGDKQPESSIQESMMN